MNKRKSGSEPTTSCFDKDRKVPTQRELLMFSLRVRVKLHWEKELVQQRQMLSLELLLGRTRHYNFLWATNLPRTRLHSSLRLASPPSLACRPETSIGSYFLVAVLASQTFPEVEVEDFALSC